MIRKKNIAPQFFQNSKRLLVIGGNSWITFFSNELIIERCRAACEHDIVRFCAVNNSCCPSGVTFGVTGCHPGNEFLVGELNRLAVSNDLIDSDRRKGERVAKTEITMTARTQQLRVARTGNEFSAGFLF